MARGGWGRREIRRRCEELKELLAASPHLCTPQELADYWPGGAENRLDKTGTWVYCYAQYCSFLRRRERDTLTESDEAEARQAALDAFREKPIPIELVGLGEDGAPRTVSVYPKSFDTLSLIDELDDNLRWALDRVNRSRKAWSAEATLDVSEALRVHTELTLTQCWILTTPGVLAPFDPSQDLPPLPAEMRTLDTLDVLNIMRAHHAIHRKRTDLTCRWLRTEDSGKAASWATIAAAAAKAQHTSVEHLLRGRSWGAWLAQAMVSWQEEFEAAERQKAEGEKSQGSKPVEMI